MRRLGVLVAAMLLGGTILGAGVALGAGSSFPDVPPGAFYADAAKWAKKHGITTGYGSTGEFRPDLPTTRGQMVTFLQRLHELQRSQGIPGAKTYSVMVPFDSWADGDTRGLPVHCPVGQTVIGGGASSVDVADLTLVEQYPTDDSLTPIAGKRADRWLVTYRNDSGGTIDGQFTAHVVCAPAS